MSDLVDRMRTCAAYLLGGRDRDAPWADEMVARDAADLLVEASNLLAAGALFDPDEPVRPVAQDVPADVLASVGAFTAAGLPVLGALARKPPSPRACPQCDSRAHKKVFRRGAAIVLECPACAHEWPYSGAAA